MNEFTPTLFKIYSKWQNHSGSISLYRVMKLLSALLQASLLAKNKNKNIKSYHKWCWLVVKGDEICAYSYLEQNEIEENIIVSVCVHWRYWGLLTFLSGLHNMDKSFPTLNMLSILYKPPDTNPLYIHIHPQWIRTDLLSVNLSASETKQALRKHFISWQNFN